MSYPHELYPYKLEPGLTSRAIRKEYPITLARSVCEFGHKLKDTLGLDIEEYIILFIHAEIMAGRPSFVDDERLGATTLTRKGMIGAEKLWNESSAEVKNAISAIQKTVRVKGYSMFEILTVIDHEQLE